MKTLKRPKRTKTKRTHLPALSALKLDGFEKRLDASTLPTVAKQAVMQSLRVAANKHAESPDVVIASMDRQDREGILQAKAEYAQTLAGPVMRGRLGLMMMSEADWEEISEN